MRIRILKHFLHDRNYRRGEELDVTGSLARQFVQKGVAVAISEQLAGTSDEGKSDDGSKPDGEKAAEGEKSGAESNSDGEKAAETEKSGKSEKTK